MAATEPLLIACKQGPTVSVNLQVPAGTKASGLQQLLAAANGVDVSNDVTIKVKTGTSGISCLALPHQPCIPLTLGAGGGACRKPSVWAAVALSPGGLASCAVALFAALGAARH